MSCASAELDNAPGFRRLDGGKHHSKAVDIVGGGRFRGRACRHRLGEGFEQSKLAAFGARRKRNALLSLIHI